jgi:hypothetical protein
MHELLDEVSDGGFWDVVAEGQILRCFGIGFGLFNVFGLVKWGN